jgi:anthranilate phosphoribosyltransferase
MDALRGGDATANAGIVRNLLQGEEGPKRDIVLLNAAYGLMAARMAETVREGMAIAADAIDSGRALAQLEKLVALTRRD